MVKAISSYVIILVYAFLPNPQTLHLQTQERAYGS